MTAAEWDAKLAQLRDLTPKYDDDYRMKVMVYNYGPRPADAPCVTWGNFTATRNDEGKIAVSWNCSDRVNLFTDVASLARQYMLSPDVTPIKNATLLRLIALQEQWVPVRWMNEYPNGAYVSYRSKEGAMQTGIPTARVAIPLYELPALAVQP